MLELQTRSAVELLHCDLTAASPAQYAGTNFFGTLRGPSKLASWLTAGEPVFGSGYQVVAWEYTDGDQVHRANKWDADSGR